MKPVSIKHVARLLGFPHKDERLITGMHIDSRSISSGDLFFALPGNRVHGHDFLLMARDKGAVAAVVSKEYRGPHFGMALIPVPDVLLALQELARKKLEQAQHKIVAITGSIGKTTTKEFTKTLLEGKYTLFASPLSYNSQSTLPLSVLMANGDEEILLLEMGMSEPGQIERLVSIAPPDVALITTVSLQHADLFPEGLSAIAKEKASIFAHKRTKIALFHHEMPYASCAKDIGSAVKKSFSTSSSQANYFGQGNVICEEKVSYQYPQLPFSGKALYHNFLAAVALARTLGVSPAQIAERVPLLVPPRSRFEKINREGVLFINDAYNANPEAMLAAFEALPPVKTGNKKIGVLSEMNALGIFSEEEHIRVGIAALQHLDHLLCIGEKCLGMRAIWREKPFELCESKEQLTLRLKAVAAPGDVVLLKGARAYALDEILKDF